MKIVMFMYLFLDDYLRNDAHLVARGLMGHGCFLVKILPSILVVGLPGAVFSS